MDGLAREDFRQLTPVSVPQDIPAPSRVWSEDEWLRIGRGHQAPDMDDRWHAFAENGRLYLYRSWTGYGIYEAQFVGVPGGRRIGEALVEGDLEHYRRHGDAYESAQLELLIDGVLCEVWSGPSHERMRRIRDDSATS